jgi:LuxR family transcriptional regulator, quorum-sensing system regulator SdiA
MTAREDVALLLHELDRRSPAGFAIALHIQFTRPALLFQTYPRRWTEYYSTAGLVLHDPTVRWGLQNVGSIRWSSLHGIDTHGVLDAARSYGIISGVTIAQVSAATRSIASFARADREFEDEEIAELEALVASLHTRNEEPGLIGEDDRSALDELSVRLTH